MVLCTAAVSHQDALAAAQLCHAAAAGRGESRRAPGTWQGQGAAAAPLQTAQRRPRAADCTPAAPPALPTSSPPRSPPLLP